MNFRMNAKSLIILSAVVFGLTACDKEEDKTEPNVSLNTPKNYEFSRNGASSVSFDGQTDRLKQIGEIKAVLQTADAGSQINEFDLLDMYANTGGNGNGNFSFTSSKQLENKTFQADVAFFQGLLVDAANASTNGAANITATDGQSGLLMRANNKTILVSDSGYEFTQLFEKGLMGAVLFYQIANVYTTDDKIGNQVDNTNLVSGENYTAMEHHMDEAFGYFGAPQDFTENYSGSGKAKYWAHYSEELNANTNAINKIMTAYKNARQAIVEKKYDLRNEYVEDINEELEKLAASAAVHYVNAALAATTDGDRMHVLSEMYGFVRALRYANPKYGEYSLSQVDALLATHIGTNFWKVTPQGLNNLKNELSNSYDLNAVKDIL